MDFGSFLTGMAQGGVKKLGGGDDGLAQVQGQGGMQSAPMQVKSQPVSGNQMSILPFIQNALSGGGQGGGGHWSVLPMISSAMGITGGQQQGQDNQHLGLLPIIGGMLGLGSKGTQQPNPSPAAPAYSSEDAYSSSPSAAATAKPQVINTQNQTSGFHGVVPMISNWVDNKAASKRDTLAQPHIDALGQANITPEERQYHTAGLQHLYSGQPQILQQMGIAPQSGGYYVPTVGAR